MRYATRMMMALAVTPLMAACASTGSATKCVDRAELRGRDGGALEVKLATVYVDDQAKALRFYTEVLGFTTRDDVQNGPYRWLTVAASTTAGTTELQLAAHDAPGAAAYQKALFSAGQPAAMLFTADLAATHARLVARGAVFTLPPTEVMPGVKIATLDDTCGNLVQITELAR